MTIQTFIHPLGRAVCVACLIVVTAPLVLAADPLPPTASAKEPGQTGGSDTATAPDKTDDVARKAEIMSSKRWRQAIFELGEWLSSQQIYSPQDVNRVKADFNRRVAGMSSYEL